MQGATTDLVYLRDGAELRYSVTGSGEPVVLVHSLGYSRLLFDQLTMGLSGYRVISYDLRGHGESSLGNLDPGLDVLADDLGELLAALGVSRAHFLGQSIGGMVLLDAACRGQLGGSLVLLDTIGWTGLEWTDRYQRRIADIHRVGMEEIALQIARVSLGQSSIARDPSVVMDYASQLSSNSAAGYEWGCRAMQSFDLRPSLRVWEDLPVMVGAGSEDAVTPYTHACSLAALCSDKPAVEIPHSGHLPVLENSEFVSNLVRSFWEEHPLTDDQ